MNISSSYKDVEGRQRDIRLDIIRSLSMFYIVFVWHFCDYLCLNPAYLTILTKCVLTTFFFISGYLLGNNKIQCNGDILTFYKRRLLRIIPMFAFSVLAFWMCGIYSLMESIKTFFCISVFVPPHARTLWFMNVIIIDYLLSPFLLYMDKKKNFFLVGGIFVLMLIILHTIGIKIDIRLLFYFPAYCVGLFWHHFKKSIFISKPICWICSIISLILFMGVYIYMVKFGYCTYSKISIILLCLIIFESFMWNMFAIQGTSSLSYFKNAFHFLAYCSFAIYLFHRPFFALIGNFCNNFHMLPDSYSSRITFLFSAPFLIFMSWLIQKCMD